MTYEQKREIVDRHLSQLGEYFEAIEIMVSTSDPSGTETIIMGHGNFWARIGMAHEFINRNERQDAASEIAHKIKEEE